MPGVGRRRRGWLGRLPRLDGKHVAEDVALTRGVLNAEARGVQDGRALVGRQRAEDMEGAAELLLAIRGQMPEGLGGGADFLLALGREAFEGLIASQEARAGGGRLRVKKAKLTEDAAALRRAEPVEAWLAAKGAFLLLQGEVPVVLKPLGEMLAAGMVLSAQGASAVHASLRSVFGRAARVAREIAMRPARRVGIRLALVPCVGTGSHGRMRSGVLAMMRLGARVGGQRQGKQDGAGCQGGWAEAG